MFIIMEESLKSIKTQLDLFANSSAFDKKAFEDQLQVDKEQNKIFINADPGQVLIFAPWVLQKRFKSD